MSSATVKLDWTHAIVVIGRVCLSAIFLISGVNKLMAPAATIAEIGAAGLPFPTLAFGLAAGIEVLCGIALLIGFRVRWAAGILAAFTLATALSFHTAFSDPNQFIHFLKNIAIVGGLLQVVALGDTGRHTDTGRPPDVRRHPDERRDLHWHRAE